MSVCLSAMSVVVYLYLFVFNYVFVYVYILFIFLFTSYLCSVGQIIKSLIFCRNHQMIMILAVIVVIAMVLLMTNGWC